MNVETFYTEVVDYMQKNIPSTDTRTAGEVTRNLERDLNSTVEWLYKNSTMSRETINSISQQITNSVKEIKNNQQRA